MTPLVAALQWLARNGRLVLVAGLLIGIGLPDLAQGLQPYIPEAAALMLFVTALRIGPREAIGRLTQIRTSLVVVLAYQIALPCMFALTFLALGLSGPIANALILVAAASPISGSPNLVLMTGNNPAPALRLLIAGTALLPITIFPAFILWPAFGDPQAALFSSLRLLALIGGATALAFVLRAAFLKSPSAGTLQAIDGLAALVMAVVVIGLMADFGYVLLERPRELAGVLAIAFAVNFGIQLCLYIALGAAGLDRSPQVAYAIAGGNRNVMLFIAALPLALTQPLLLFIACYQIPMYLTPLLLGRLYRSRPAAQT